MNAKTVYECTKLFTVEEKYNILVGDTIHRCAPKENMIYFLFWINSHNPELDVGEKILQIGKIDKSLFNEHFKEKVNE